MKQLNPGPTVVIPSNHPRTRRGSDSRGIRICVQELGRSCSLDQGFIKFLDGSQYAYDPGSKADIENLCDSFIRGRQFNFSVRRAVSGFQRSPVLPGDYEVIYTYPPYPGTAPGPCPKGNFLGWFQVSSHDPSVVISEGNFFFQFDTALNTGVPADGFVDDGGEWQNDTAGSLTLHLSMPYAFTNLAAGNGSLRLRVTDQFSNPLISQTVSTLTDPLSGTIAFDWLTAAGDIVIVQVTSSSQNAGWDTAGDLDVTIT